MGVHSLLARYLNSPDSVPSKLYPLALRARKTKVYYYFVLFCFLSVSSPPHSTNCKLTLQPKVIKMGKLSHAHSFVLGSVIAYHITISLVTYVRDIYFVTDGSLVWSWLWVFHSVSQTFKQSASQEVFSGV